MNNVSVCPVELLQDQPEFDNLIEAYKVIQPRNVLEIGSLFGGTLWHWMKHNSRADARFATIDLWVGAGDSRRHAQIKGHGGLWKSWADNRPFFAANRRSADAETLQTAKEWFPDGIDWLFIDGDHRYEAVKADFELYKPLVTPGGSVVLHDIYRAVGVDNVPKFWAELNANSLPGQCVEFASVTDQKDRGIGLWKRL